ncbi:MAG: hypothetical protein WB992_09600 [Bryobacteraceae bacterium]
MDEKTAIQALDRLGPVLPLWPGRAEPSVTGLLRRYINAYSANAKPIRWKYSDPTRCIGRNVVSATCHYLGAS